MGIMETVEEKVIKIIQGKLPQSRKNISLEDRLFEDIDIDSLDCVEVGMEIEMEYGIKDFTVEGGLFNPSVQEIVNQVKSHIENKLSGLELIAKEREILTETDYYSTYEIETGIDGMFSVNVYRTVPQTGDGIIKDGEYVPNEYTTEIRIQELAKAGALIAAEIDRLNKLEENK